MQTRNVSVMLLCATQASMRTLPNSKLSRIVSGAQRYVHVTPILRQLKWLPVKTHLYYRDLIMASKCMNCLVPEYLSDQFIKRSSISTHRTRNSQLLNIPLFRSATGQRTFSYQIVSLWNALPQNIKLSQSLAQFKTMMRKRLLTDSNRTQPATARTRTQ